MGDNANVSSFCTEHWNDRNEIQVKYYLSFLVACECNGQAENCHPETGRCFCTTKGVTGEDCGRCDTQSNYAGNPINGSCFCNTDFHHISGNEFEHCFIIFFVCDIIL